MRKLLSLWLLSVLAFSIFALTNLVPTVSAKRPEWFFWDVYLYFPPGAPPTPYKMVSSVWWVNLDNIVNSEDLYIREVVAGNKYFLFRGVKDYVDITGDGEVDGTYVLEMLIVWELPIDFVPGEKSIAGGIILHRGTGCFQGMNAYGSASVEIQSDPDYGLILIQHQEGYIINSP
jgi:hypothetical protein